MVWSSYLTCAEWKPNALARKALNPHSLYSLAFLLKGFSLISETSQIKRSLLVLALPTTCQFTLRANNALQSNCSQIQISAVQSRHEIPTRQTAPTQTQPGLGWVGLASSNTCNPVGGLGQYRLGWVNLLGCDLHHYYLLRKVSCLFRKNAIHSGVDHFLIQ